MKRRAFALVLLGFVVAGCDNRQAGGLVGISTTGTRLAFRTQPSNVVVNAAIAPVVQVEVLNNAGQLVTNSTAPVTITIVPGTGNATALLTGGESQNASGGIVNFGNLRINAPGTGYQLQASAPGLTSAMSTAFNVTP